MIIFQELRFKNFLSYGNNWTSFKFKKGIIDISGKNGDGKSCINDCFYYVLFGIPFRNINIKQLINSKNKKGLEVILTFKKQEDEFRIERGLKPDYFKIYKNDVIVPVSSSKRGYQEILEEDIFQFDRNIVDQVTVKSMTKNTAFMTLKKAEKRKVIENILDIEVFSIMGKSLKLKIDKKEEELREVNKDNEHTDLLICQEKENLEKLSNLSRKIEAEVNQNIQVYKDEITELKISGLKYKKGLEIIEKKKLEYKELSDSLNITKESIHTRTQAITKFDTMIALNEKKVKFLNNTCGDCPKINVLVNDTDVLDANTNLASEKLKRTFEENIQKTTEEKINKVSEILANEKLVLDLLSKAKSRIKELQSIIDKPLESVIKLDQSKFKEYKTKKSDLECRYNDLHKSKIHLVLLRSLCSDDGIKTLIIKKYLPTINKLLNTYLTKFQADIVFEFDEEFNEVIKTRYKEMYSYESFSQGQKKRIDLAVMFAFIKFSQMKNKSSDTNILILDEVLTSLDSEGTELVFDVLKDYKEKHNKCIIIIKQLTELNHIEFDHKYMVSLDKGFSKIEEVLK